MLGAGAMLAAAVLFRPAPAEAFQLVPITQDFDPAGRGANKTFRLENPDAREATILLKVTTRKMDLDGHETAEESDDFIVFPTEAIVAPGGVQIVRVQYVGPTNLTQEVPYRIIAEGAPITSAPGQASQILIAVRYAGTVYVTPKDAKPQVVLESAGPSAGAGPHQMEVILHNEGNAHGLLVDPVLTVAKGGVTRNLSGDALRAIAGENVLPGNRRRFLIPWPADLPFGPLDSSQFKASFER
jgi:fimbrial chaperone protein